MGVCFTIIIFQRKLWQFSLKKKKKKKKDQISSDAVVICSLRVKKYIYLVLGVFRSKNALQFATFEHGNICQEDLSTNFRKVSSIGRLAGRVKGGEGVRLIDVCGEYFLSVYTAAESFSYFPDGVCFINEERIHVFYHIYAKPVHPCRNYHTLCYNSFTWSGLCYHNCLHQSTLNNLVSS